MAALESSREENFVQNLVAGMSQRQAYLEAYPKAKGWKPATVDNRAYQLFHKNEVYTRYEELQHQAAAAAILTRTDRMIMLSEIATDIEQNVKNRLQAVDLLNKMDGEYTKRIEAVVTTDFSAIADKVGAILDE